MNKFDAVPFESKGGKWQPRYYQENAITSVLEAISTGKEKNVTNSCYWYW